MKQKSINTNTSLINSPNKHRFNIDVFEIISFALTTPYLTSIVNISRKTAHSF